MYVYLDLTREYGTYTVGFYTPDGKWVPERDCGTSDEAAARVAFLNGGSPPLKDASVA